MLQALISYFPEKEKVTGVGALEYSKEERKKLAQMSRTWKCHICGPIIDHIPYKIKELKKNQENSENSGKSDEIPIMNSNVTEKEKNDDNLKENSLLIEHKENTESNSQYNNSNEPINNLFKSEEPLQLQEINYDKEIINNLSSNKNKIDGVNSRRIKYRGGPKISKHSKTNMPWKKREEIYNFALERSNIFDIST